MVDHLTSPPSAPGDPESWCMTPPDQSSAHVHARHAELVPILTRRPTASSGPTLDMSLSSATSILG